MKNKILGWIGVVWGAVILLGGGLLFVAGQGGAGAYGAGQLFALGLGALFVYAGIRALRFEAARTSK